MITKPKRYSAFLITCLISLTVWASSAGAQTVSPSSPIKGKYEIPFNGTIYEVIELKQDRREVISKWNALIFRRGKPYMEFKVKDSEYTLKIPKKEVKKLGKDYLKGLTDNRPYEDKNPWLFSKQEHFRRNGPIYNFCLGGTINGIQAGALAGGK